MRKRKQLTQFFAKFSFVLGTLLCLTGWGPFSWFTRPIPEPMGTSSWLQHEMSQICSHASNINRSVLKLSLEAFIKARHRGLDSKQLVTIIDYSKPSTERRLWVIDLRTGEVLFNTWVTHGRNSGVTQATSFSNQPGSLKSSIGVFVTTGSPYTGSNGYSLRLAGLENGINDNAYRRAIVFHGAWYASPAVIQKYGVLGRSWGCPAVSMETIRPLINAIKDQTLVFVYYPDPRWLYHSAFLAG